MDSDFQNSRGSADEPIQPLGDQGMDAQRPLRSVEELITDFHRLYEQAEETRRKMDAVMRQLNPQANRHQAER